MNLTVSLIQGLALLDTKHEVIKEVILHKSISMPAAPTEGLFMSFGDPDEEGETIGCMVDFVAWDVDEEAYEAYFPFYDTVDVDHYAYIIRKLRSVGFRDMD